MADKTWPWEKSNLNHDTFARFEAVKFRNGVELGLEVLPDGTLKAGSFIVNGHHWIEDNDVPAAFDFSSLLNQPAQAVLKLYAQYTYTATIPHASAVYGFAATLPSNAISIGQLTVPASTAAINASMINLNDDVRDLSNRYIADNATLASSPLLPTADEKAAMAGIALPPNAANRFATNSDITALGVGADNLGNHIATQDLDFSNFKGINVADPVSPKDAANRQFVLANIGGANLATSIEQLRKQVAENALLIDGIQSSPYPDNFGQPYYRTTFDFLFNYNADVSGVAILSDHNLKATTANIVTLDKAERSRLDLRLDLPDQKYYGETTKVGLVPDVADRPHAITYVAELAKIFMITYGSRPDDTTLHAIDPITMEIESTWFFDEGSFTRWNGKASGITYGAGQLFLVEHNDTSAGSVCIRFAVAALPPNGQKITKLNVLAIESAVSTDVASTDAFIDVAFDGPSNVLWALERSGPANHRLTRLKTDFTENGIVRAGGIDITTSAIDTEINGLDFDGYFLWFTGNVWTGKMDTSANISSKFKQHGRTGICRVIDAMFPAVSGNIFCTDQNRNDIKMVAISNAYAYAPNPDYQIVNDVVLVNSVNDTLKTVSFFKVDGTSPVFKDNDYAGGNLRHGNNVWKIKSNIASELTLDTTDTIASITGLIEIGSLIKRNVTVMNSLGQCIDSFEGGTDSVVIDTIGIVLSQDTVINAVGAEIGALVTPGTLEFRIETDTAGAPSGTLVDPNATVTIPGVNLTANAFNETSFPATFTLLANTLYHIKYVKGFVGDIKGSSIAQSRAITAGMFNYCLYNNSATPSGNLSTVAAFENRINFGFVNSLGAVVHVPDEIDLDDTYISQNSPTVNSNSDEFLRLGAGDIDKWTQETDGPTALAGHTMVLDPGSNKAYLFGGRTSSGLSGTLWEYTRTTNSWIVKNPTSSPVGREGHVAVIYNGKMYIHGGHDGNNTLNDLWVYDPLAGPEGQWNQLISGEIRQSHAAAVVGDKLYIHGGISSMGHDSLHVYDFTLNTWSTLANGSSTRWNHTIVGNTNSLFVFGGYNGTGLNDVWEYTIGTDTWHKKNSGATARWGHTANLVGDLMFVFGGASENVLADLWTYHVINDTWERKRENEEAAGRHTAIAYPSELFVYGGWVGTYKATQFNYVLPVNVSVSRVLLKFNLTGLPTVANNVKFGIYVARANDRDKVVDLHQLNQPFVPGQATWNESAASTGWTLAGGDFVTVLTDSKTIKNHIGYVEFDITTLYNNWQSGAMPNNGLVLKLNNETVIGDIVDIHTSGSVVKNRGPRLAISTLVSNNNAAVITPNKDVITQDFSSLSVKDLAIGGEFMLQVLDDRVNVVDKVDQTLLYSLTNKSTPSITSSVVTGAVYRELPTGPNNSRTNKFVVVACDNGVSVINLDTGTSYKMFNYEFVSDEVAITGVVLSERGYLYIVYEPSHVTINRIAVYGNIARINSDNATMSWELQTGKFDILSGPSLTGILPSEFINNIDVTSKTADLHGRDTDLLYIANGRHITEVDIDANQAKVLGVANQDMTCQQVLYYRNVLVALLSNKETAISPNVMSQINVYDVYSGKLIRSISNTDNTNSHYTLKNAEYKRFIISEEKLILVSLTGLEIIDLPRVNTHVFGDAEWHTELFDDTNGIARLTTMSKDIVLPRERIEFNVAASRGDASITVAFGPLGSVVSPGDTLNLYSASGLDAGKGERVVVSLAYDGLSNVLPLAETTLAENIDETSFVIKLTDLAVVQALPIRGVVRIGTEDIEYDGKSGFNIIVRTRGLNGTVAASHVLGDPVNTVLSNDYVAKDSVTFQISTSKTDSVLDVRAHESSDALSFAVSPQILINDVVSGFFNEAVLADLPYAKLVYNLKSSQFGGSIKIGKTSAYWENF